MKFKNLQIGSEFACGGRRYIKTQNFGDADVFNAVALSEDGGQAIEWFHDDEEMSVVTTELRQIMHKQICVMGGYSDYCYKRGDQKAKEFKNYSDWLDSLPNDEFLDAFNRVRDAENERED